MAQFRSRVAVAGLALSALLAGCASSPQNGSQGGGDPEELGLPSSIPLAADFNPDATFVWANAFGATSWDPILSTTGGDRDLLIPVYDRLLYSGPQGDLEPMLALSWEPSADNTSLTVKLRPDVTFSDGTAFDAEAVKFNLERARQENSTVKNEVAMLTGVEVVDDLTVVFTVSGELGAFTSALANKPGMMVSPTAAAAGGLATQPVGVGPYLVEEVIPGDKVTYVRAPNYWDPEAQNVETMIYRIIPDEQTRFNALKSGEVDGAPLSPSQVDAAVDAGIQVISGPSPIFAYLAVNNSIAPFDDPLVREALHYAIDREAIGEGLYDGFCTPQIQPWPQSSFAYSDEVGAGLDIWPYDPEKAKELLTEAGHEDGFSVTLMTTNLSGYMKLGEVVQSQLKDIGIDITIVNVPPAQFIEDFSINKSIPMVVNGYPGAPDPDDVYKRLLQPNSVVNPGGNLATEVSDLATAAAATIDPAERSPIYGELMQQLIDEPSHLLTICMQQSSEGYADEVSNVSVYSNGARDRRGAAVSE